MAHPDTARPDASVWKQIDRVAFDHQTSALQHKSHVAGRRCYSLVSSGDATRGCVLTLEVEQGLANDFAFIAACEPEAHYVSAAAIEYVGSEASILIKLAANEGVCSKVRRTFDKLLEVLKQHARKDITRRCCEETLLSIILQLNCNRVLGRLGSPAFERPQHLRNSRALSPLPTRLAKICADRLAKASLLPGGQDATQLELELRAFEDACHAVNGVDADARIHALARTVRCAYDLCGDGLQFPARLNALDFPETILDSREIREVGKVANYWRIARNLAMCSLKYRSQFSNIAFDAIQHYAPSTRSKILPKLFVHAEIQILIHYEIDRSIVAPTVIGVSKEACFLCDAFIQAHGRHSITGAHRQVFAQWTVPDLVDFSAEAVARIRRALSQVAKEVNKEVSRSRQKKQTWRALPVQSAINLNVPHLATPSSSATWQRNDGQQQSAASEATQTSDTAEADVAADADDAAPSLLCAGAVNEMSPTGVSGHHVQAAQVIQELPLEISIASRDRVCVEWIQIFAALSITNQQDQTAQNSLPEVSLEARHYDDFYHTVHIADLESREEMLLDLDLGSSITKILVIGTKGREACITLNTDVLHQDHESSPHQAV